MGVPHDHLERPVAEQLCDGSQIHSRHHQSTGKRMAVAMPAVAFNLRLFERAGKPARDPCRDAPLRGEGRRALISFSYPPRAAPGRAAARATAFRGMVRGSPFLVWADESADARSRSGSNRDRIARSSASRNERTEGSEARTPENAAGWPPAGGPLPRRTGIGRVLRLPSCGECGPPDSGRSSRCRCSL